MKSISIGFRALVIRHRGVLLLAGSANAAEVRVMISGGLTAAYKELVPEFERAHRQQGHHGLRPLDGHHRECDSGPAGARRTR